MVGLHLRPDEAPQEAWAQVFTVAPILALSLKYTLQRTVSNALFLSTTYLAFSQMITLGGCATAGLQPVLRWQEQLG